MAPLSEFAARPYFMGDDYVPISNSKRSFIKIGSQTMEKISEQTDRNTHTHTNHRYEFKGYVASPCTNRVRKKLLTHQRQEQSGFTPMKSTVDRILALRVLSEPLRDFRIVL